MSSTGLLVLGMHRSGTSALTGVLAKLGAYPGPVLVPGIAEVNLKGFWEHPGVVGVHERLLEALHASWHDVANFPAQWWLAPGISRYAAEIKELLERDFIGHPFWVLKDPRMCRLLPIWIPVLKEKNIEARYIIALRNPLEVAASLKKRDGLPMAHGCLLWLVYMIAAEQATRGEMRMFIDYGELLSDWRSVISRVVRKLRLELTLDDAVAVAEVDSFLDPNLKHYAGVRVDADHPAIHCAREFYERLTACAEEDVEAMVDECAPVAVGLVDIVTPWSDSINSLRLNVTEARTEADLQTQRAANYEQEVARIKGSLSWRITAPLRVFQNGWRRLMGKSWRDI